MQSIDARTGMSFSTTFQATTEVRHRSARIKRQRSLSVVLFGSPLNSVETPQQTVNRSSESPSRKKGVIPLRAELRELQSKSTVIRLLTDVRMAVDTRFIGTRILRPQATLRIIDTRTEKTLNENNSPTPKPMHRGTINQDHPRRHINSSRDMRRTIPKPISDVCQNRNILGQPLQLFGHHETSIGGTTSVPPHQPATATNNPCDTTIAAGDAIREADVMDAGMPSRQRMNRDRVAATAAH
jgi:hypothetical protein